MLDLLSAMFAPPLDLGVAAVVLVAGIVADTAHCIGEEDIPSQVIFDAHVPAASNVKDSCGDGVDGVPKQE